MNKTKKVKLFMIITGVIIGVILVLFMILNNYLFKLDFKWTLLCSFLIILFWIIINYIGIKILLRKYH